MKACGAEKNSVKLSRETSRGGRFRPPPPPGPFRVKGLLLNQGKGSLVHVGIGFYTVMIDDMSSRHTTRHTKNASNEYSSSSRVNVKALRFLFFSVCISIDLFICLIHSLLSYTLLHNYMLLLVSDTRLLVPMPHEYLYNFKIVVIYKYPYQHNCRFCNCIHVLILILIIPIAMLITVKLVFT